MYKISSLKSKCKIFKIDLLVRHLYTKLKMNVDLLKRLCTQKVFHSLGEKKTDQSSRHPFYEWIFYVVCIPRPTTW